MASIHFGTPNQPSVCRRHVPAFVRHCVVAALVDGIAIAAHASALARLTLLGLLVAVELVRTHYRK